jgi:hypothetical protein
MTKLTKASLQRIIRETYEDACMECGYEEGIHEEEEALEEYLAEAKKNWIKKAVKKPGSLRATAKRKGLVKGDEPLSKTDLEKLEDMGGKTAKRARLAKTLKSLKK